MISQSLRAHLQSAEQELYPVAEDGVVVLVICNVIAAVIIMIVYQ